MSRRRVLVLAKTTALGGAERLLMNGLPYLARDRFDYRFAAFDGGGPLEEACRAAGLPFETLPARGALTLRRRMEGGGIDVLHAHLPLPGAIARLARRGLRTRLVYTEHTTQDVYRAPSRWLNRLSYGWQHAVIAVSERVRESAERHIGSAARQIQVIPNGVDLARLDREAAATQALPERAPGAVTLCVAASLTPVKGHDVLLDALERLPAAGPPIEVWLAGDGPGRAALAARARNLSGGAARVQLLGERRDVFALMAASDVVALPSRREGQPLALLEAMALGRAVVASAVGGIPEVVEPGRSGLLVPALDAEALSCALQRLRLDAALRLRLGDAARRHARARHDVRRQVAAVEALYDAMAPAPRRRPAPLSATACP